MRVFCLFLRSVDKSRSVLIFFVRLTGTFHIANKINLVFCPPAPPQDSRPNLMHLLSALEKSPFSGCLLITEYTWTCL
jgi:hypothetical protein